MLAALALVLAAGNAPFPHEARPVVALVPLRPLGVPPDLVHALQVTLHNELSALPEAKLAPEKEVADQLKREPECEARVSCAALAASRAGARQLIMGTASQLGDAFMIDLKLLDARSGQELRRVTHPVSGSPDALIDTSREAIVQLLAPARFVGAMRIDVPGVSGAMLFVDGKAVGSTPLAKPIEGLSPGPHTVRVVPPGSVEEASTFVDVRFGQVTDARIDLKALKAVPVQALPAASSPGASSARKPWMRPVALGVAGLGAASAVIAVVFQARAYATAGDLNRRESLNQLQPSDLSGYRDVDHDTRLARGFYVTAAVLAAAGGGLFLWDMHLSPGGISGHF
jgi:hypothetical protein